MDPEEIHIVTICILFFFSNVNSVWGLKDVWENVECDEYLYPDNCDFGKITLHTVEDYERCAPAKLPLYARNYYLGRSGRGITYKDNREAFKRIKIIPKLLRDVSQNSLEISTLGQQISFPVGISPTGLHMLADPQGENATAAAAADMNTVMIVSSYSSIRLEEVAAAVEGSPAKLWIQTYIFRNRSYTKDIVQRAEKSGYKALVITVDSVVFPPLTCDAANSSELENIQLPNIPESFTSVKTAVITFNDIKWLKSITKMPIVAKGILSGDDAQRAINAGASAILVSNHGGRQLDGTPASIDVLPKVVETINMMYPRRDIYLDGGIRNGFDVYKALARGAKMVFIGRPVLWGLAMEGEEGVKKVLNILKTEFNNTMLLAGASNPNKIRMDTLSPPITGWTG